MNMNMNEDSLRIRRYSDSISSIYCSSQEDIQTASSTDNDIHDKKWKQQHLSATTQTIRRTIIYATIITSCMMSISMLIHLMNATPPFTIDTNPFDMIMGYNEEIDPQVLSKCDEKISSLNWQLTNWQLEYWQRHNWQPDNWQR